VVFQAWRVMRHGFGSGLAKVSIQLQVSRRWPKVKIQNLLGKQPATQ
jgi:hypothetical protein